jgi:hypothetical protein
MTASLLKKGDLVKVKDPDNFWNGMVGIVVGAYLAYLREEEFYKPVRVRFPQIGRLGIEASCLSEPESLINCFAFCELEKIE